MSQPGVVIVHRGQKGHQIADLLVHQLLGRKFVSCATVTVNPGRPNERLQYLEAQFAHYAKGLDVAFLVIVTEDLFGSDISGTPIRRPLDHVRQELEAALRYGLRVIPVLVDGSEMPPAGHLPLSLVPLTELHAFPLRQSHWVHDLSRLGRAIAGVRSSTGLAKAAAASSFGATKLRGLLRMLIGIPIAPQDKYTENHSTLFAASVPRSCRLQDQFVARLVIYAEGMRSSALKKLRPNMADLMQSQDDVRPHSEGGWEPGTPFAVTLVGDGFHIDSPVRTVVWNGLESLVEFAVRPENIRNAGQQGLVFHVSVAGVCIASIMFSIRIQRTVGGDFQLGISTIEYSGKLPQSAFASYASTDRNKVMECLSVLCSYNKDLRVFVDCLDLNPGDEFKSKLQQEIVARDAFLLFWSRSASESKWVKWELGVAQGAKGNAGIVIIPVPRVKQANPPEGFESKHVSNRYLIVSGVSPS